MALVSINTSQIYLDHHAGWPVGAPARVAITEALTGAGNPSSIHAAGRAARAQVERARDAVAEALACDRTQVVFTSGGTEANGLALTSLGAAAAARGLREAWLCPVDHPSLRGAAEALGARGLTVRWLPVDANGVVQVAEVASSLAAGPTLVAAAWVNHELGVIQPIEALGEAVHAGGGWLHVDAVQALGKMALATIRPHADSVAVSGHKIGAPAGVGALAWRPAVPLITSGSWGHQELGRRPGSENLLGIVGFGAAVTALQTIAWGPALAAMAHLEAGLVARGAIVHGASAARTGTVVSARWPGRRGQAVVIGLDLRGIAISTGAACTSGTVAPSPTLLAIGLREADALSTVRISAGPDTSRADVDACLVALDAVFAHLPVAQI